MYTQRRAEKELRVARALLATALVFAFFASAL
jgi:hypothetical protein